MNRISIILLTILLSACNCRYNGIDTREVLVSSDINQAFIDVTEPQVIDVR